MNQLMNNQKAEMTMCSRDIADLTGKRHDHVMADINKMIEWLGDTCPDFSGELPAQSIFHHWWRIQTTNGGLVKLLRCKG